MRLHFLQHVPFEDPANILPWAQARRITTVGVRIYANETLPPPRALDWLVVMGGPMSVDEEDKHPWLAAEKRYIRAAIDAGKRVIGVCLGAQLVAEALGGEVTRNAHREIGWFPVTRTEASDASPAFRVLPRTFPAFHWHGDTFSLPPGATHLAASEACPMQAFAVESRIFGLQFHLESARGSIESLLTYCAADLADGPFVQSAETIRAGYDANLPVIMGLMTAFLDALRDQG
ncbi:MAG TPA: type 1 glutamine amidotransferase [Candidatus Hydrogenedentes bacterium]|nr:type 1 glutamine amidotransferase [Candidatus Hydrogenedentota bacterium]